MSLRDGPCTGAAGDPLLSLATSWLFVCPAGSEQSLGLRIERSPPTRRSGRSVPARSAGMAPIARGAEFTPTPRFPLYLHTPDALARPLVLLVGPPRYGRGAVNPPRGCQRPCLRRLRVTERAARGGVSLARLHANSEGPRHGTTQFGRSRRSLGAQRAGASKRREAAHPRGKKRSAGLRTLTVKTTAGFPWMTRWLYEPERPYSEASSAKRSRSPSPSIQSVRRNRQFPFVVAGVFMRQSAPSPAMS